MNSDYINKESSNSGEITLKDVILKLKEWIKYLFSKWLVIALFVALGSILGLIYANFKKPVYTASTTFVLEEGADGGSLGGLGGLASMAGIDLGGGQGGIFKGDNILELYKSRTMIEKTLLTEVENNGKKQLLVNRYIDFNKLREKWTTKDIPSEKVNFNVSENPTMVSPGLVRLRDSILGTIVEDINKKYLIVGKPDKKLNIIKADVKAPDEFFAKAFNDEIVKNVNDFYIQTRTKKSLQNVEILQQKTDSVIGVMDKSIFASAATLDATPNLNPTRQSLRAPVQRYQFSAEINKAILGELVKNLELSKISLVKEAPLIQVIDQPVFPLYKQKFGYLKGMIFGGLILGFLSVVCLFLRKVYKEVTN